MPAPAKANPKLASALSDLEAQISESMDINFDLSPGETRMLKFADRLDAYWYAMHHKPQLATQEDWIDAAIWLDAEIKDMKLEIRL